MFGVGLQFSMHELLSVRASRCRARWCRSRSRPCSVRRWRGCMAGVGRRHRLRRSPVGRQHGCRFAQLPERRLLDNERGHIAVGWLVVEDLAMVLVLVFLPSLADLAKGGAVSPSAIALPLAITLGKFLAFGILMWLVGRRVIPWLLHYVAHTGSRELFRLSVLAIALGVAYGAATLFDVSFALGAFFAGMILSELTLSQRAAQETLPLRDAFAVLFFVSVGMLFDPYIIVSHPLPLLATLLIITLGKSTVAYAVMRLFRYPESSALMIAASRAQIGEFSFILAGLGVALGILPEAGRDLILAGALISILLTPFLFAGADWIYAHHEPPKKAPANLPPRPNLNRSPSPRRRRARRYRSRAHQSRGARRLRPRRQRRGDGAQGRRRASVRDRERRGHRRPSAQGRDGSHLRQRSRSGACDGRELWGRALPAGRDPRWIRGRTGCRTGARHQPQSSDHRACAFGGRDRASEAPRRHQNHHGRIPNRAGDDCGCA